MSDEQLDDHLKNRIKQVFDNYEDNTAEEGWLRLREKYPEQERRRVVWLWRIAGAAALLLAALGIGLWLNFHGADKQLISNIKKIKINDTATLKPANTAENNHSTGSGNIVAYQKPGNVLKHPHNFFMPGPLHINPRHNMANTIIKAGNPAGNNIHQALVYQATNKAKPDNVIDSNASVTASSKALPGTGVTTTQKPVEKDQNVLAESKSTNKGIQSLFENDKYKTEPSTEKQKIKDKSVTFSVYAATYVSYAKGSNKQFNNGGGLTADIKLTNNLSFSTGLFIGQNSLNYNYNNTNSTIYSSPITVASATFITLTSDNYRSNNIVLPTTSKNLNASLVSLDIPVDLKYVFNPEKRNTYIAAGLSSGTFINETYNYTYKYTIPNSGISPQSQQQNNSNAFDNFYFGKMVNVSFGVGYRLGRNQLVIEPFFKYPLDGLGDQHLIFGSGGINLKFNLDPRKTKSE